MKKDTWVWIAIPLLLTIVTVAGCLLAYTTIGAK